MRRPLVRSSACLSLALLLAGCDADFGETDPPGYDVRVPLRAPAAPGGTGFVEVDRVGDAEDVEIVVDYSPTAAARRYDVHLHRGTCEQPGTVARPLDDVVDGRSRTSVPIGSDDLLTGDYAVDVHPAGDDTHPARACAEIVAAEVER